MLHEIAKELKREDRRSKYRREFLRSADNDQPIYMTDILLLPQPAQTDALMAIAGHDWEGQAQRNAQEEPIEVRKFRLMSIDPSYPIQVKRKVTVRRPGTDQETQEATWIKLGQDVTVTWREASAILWAEGWPVKQALFREGISLARHDIGRVVEVEWLRAEAQKPNVLPEVKAIWEQVEKRLAKAASKKEGS